jgi:hypothetical protein
MQRRSFVTALLLSASCAARPQDAQAPRHKVSASELHASLSNRFPVRFGFGGLLVVQVSAPALLLLPQRNQLGATLVAEAGGAAVQPMPPGELDVVFSLRWEPRDQTLRAHEADVLGVRWPGMPRDAADALQRSLPGMARDALGEIVLHRFSRGELALADTMGFEPRTFTVTDDGLVIGFGPKR